MAEQLPLHVDVCRSRHGGNQESKEAHASVIPAKEHQWKRIVDFVRSRGDEGATTEEIAVAIGMRMQSVSARRSELIANGDLIKTERRRKTSSGHPAAVVVAKENP